ncbi:MAG: lipase family protein [Mycobacterium sp.]
MRTPLLTFAAALLGIALLAGCQSSPTIDIQRAQTPMEYSRDVPAITPQDWAIRGTVLSSTDQASFDMSQFPAGSSVKTFVYQSISGITGAPTVVGGAVLTPPGTPPPGGWPVIGYAHFTTGVMSDCGTLEDPQLAGNLPGVDALLDQGYAVAYTDYAGLGKAATDGGADEVHPYLEPKSEAFNLIDAVRAARSLDPALSNRWVAYGGSQGGQAAWAAAEYFPTYGEGTELLGAVTLAPALDVSGLADLAENSELTTDQRNIYPLVITGLAAVDPEINPDDYFGGDLRRGLGAVVACRGPNADHHDEVIDAADRSDLKRPSPDATARLLRRLESYSLPQRPTITPLLAIYGGTDSLVLPEWTTAAIERACAIGDNVTEVLIPEQGHSVEAGPTDDRWIADRFAGLPANGTC